MNETSSFIVRHSCAVDWLRHEYARRKSRNPNYSLRAFAKFLKLPAGALSEIFSKKRKITVKQGEKFVTRLGFSPGERGEFINLIRKEPASYHQLPSDIFALICDWYHYALLSLMETKTFRNDPKWIANRLGISVTEVRIALERLLRLGMIHKRGDHLIPTSGWSTTDDIPSEALRHYHRQGLEQATRAIEEVPALERDITSIVMAIDPKRLELAKTALKKVRRHVADLLECGDQTEVYRLNIQLVPITKKES